MKKQTRTVATLAIATFGWIAAAAAQGTGGGHMRQRSGGPGGPGGPPDGKGGPGPEPGKQQGPPPKPLTPEQVGLVRAWIDQGAK